MEEKRKYARLKVGTRINFRVKGKGKTPLKKISAMSKNISAEGICFRTNQELAVGTELEIEIFLPSDPEPILLRAEVRGCSPFQEKEKGKTVFDTGVQLFIIDRSNENRYMAYVCNRMTERLSRFLQL